MGIAFSGTLNHNTVDQGNLNDEYYTGALNGLNKSWALSSSGMEEKKRPFEFATSGSLLPLVQHFLELLF